MRQKAIAGMICGIMMFGSVLTTAAFAGGPPKKKPPVKGKNKPAPKKEDNKALIADGKKIYTANGCAGCHAISGMGGMTAPELTKIAADPKHNAKWLEEAVVSPTKHNPDSKMPPYDSIKGKDLKALVAYLASLK